MISLRRTLALVCVLLLIVSLSACNRRSSPIRTETQTELAQEFLTFIKDKNFIQAVKMFDSTLKAELPVSKLEAVWSSIESQAGAYVRLADATTEISGEYLVVLVPMEFTTAILEARVVFNSRKEISGLFFAPPVSNAYVSPSYVHTDRFTEREVQVGKGEWALPGTLTVPKLTGLLPAVVLVHGSGPNDRDETIYSSKPFRDLAQGLASMGIVVLRYDKRTLVHGAKMVQAGAITPQEETVDDAVSAVDILRLQPEVDPDRVFVLGHSLGGLLAPRIAAQASSVRGVIILAGSVRPLEDIVLEQVTYIYNLDGSLTSIEKQHIKELQAQIARVKDPKLTKQVASTLLPLGLPADYWLYLREYDPRGTAKTLSQPMLILQGERDYQVPIADFMLWKQLERDNITFKLYPDLNHLFISGSGISQPSEYLIPGNVSETVIVDIQSWIKEH